MRVGGVDHGHQAVFQGFGLREDGPEAFLEIGVRDGAVQGLLHGFEEDLRAVADFARKAKRLGDTGIELPVDGVARSPVAFGVTQDHADLAFAHDTDVLHADFGILRDLHVGAETDAHDHAVTGEADVFHLAHLDAVDLDRIIEHQGADLGEAEVERIKSFPGVLLVQEEHAED